MHVPKTLRARTSEPPRNRPIPGDRVAERKIASVPTKQLGMIQQGLLHALTFAGYAENMDQKVRSLPSETYLNNLTRPQKDFLSFTAYSLKQMTLAGTISPESAWTLLSFGLEQVKEVDEITFKGMRESFFFTSRNHIAGRRGLEDLLEFEFYARAKSSGLAQFEKYKEYTLEFNGVPEYLKEEYRKALWLEMNLIEAQVGITGLNPERIKRFKLSREGQYFRGIEQIEGSIDLYNTIGKTKRGLAIDLMIKAELGHWMFSVFFQGNSWANELMDRMNACGFTKDVNEAFVITKYTRTPMQRVFMEGAIPHAIRGVGYACYPEMIPFSYVLVHADHVVAEAVEWEIRQRVIEAVKTGTPNKLDSHKAFQTYRKLGLYAAILFVEGKSVGQILAKLKQFNMREINSYFNNYKEMTHRAIKRAMRAKDYDSAAGIAEMIGSFGVTSALPTLEACIGDKDVDLNGKVAEAIMKIRGIASSDAEEYAKYYPYVAIMKDQINETIAFGIAALPALERTLKIFGKDNSIIQKFAVAEAIIKIKGEDSIPPSRLGADEIGLYTYAVIYEIIFGGDLERKNASKLLRAIWVESQPILEACLEDVDRVQRGLIAEKLLELQDKLLPEEKDKPKIWQAYVFMKDLEIEKASALGKLALPALRAALGRVGASEKRQIERAIRKIERKAL